jgi:hypothetical protein
MEANRGADPPAGLPATAVSSDPLERALALTAELLELVGVARRREAEMQAQRDVLRRELEAARGAEDDAEAAPAQRPSHAEDLRGALGKALGRDATPRPALARLFGDGVG